MGYSPKSIAVDAEVVQSIDHFVRNAHPTHAHTGDLIHLLLFVHANDAAAFPAPMASCAAFHLEREAHDLARAAMVMQRRMVLMEYTPLAVAPEPDAYSWGNVKLDPRFAAHPWLTGGEASAIGFPRTLVAPNPEYRDAVCKRLLKLALKHFCPKKQCGLCFSGSMMTDGRGPSLQLATVGTNGPMPVEKAPPMHTSPTSPMTPRLARGTPATVACAWPST